MLFRRDKHPFANLSQEWCFLLFRTGSFTFFVFCISCPHHVLVITSTPFLTSHKYTIFKVFIIEIVTHTQQVKSRLSSSSSPLSQFSSIYIHTHTFIDLCVCLTSNCHCRQWMPASIICTFFLFFLICPCVVCNHCTDTSDDSFLNVWV